ncbi:MAG TPA: hypothetical protein PLD25_08005 [Chloroflexota bacterium]|nr:hypothetical protein [Chloroflexota bacterium]HUM68074.1 hypothetical protein [Chloroflexota bacterium]
MNEIQTSKDCRFWNSWVLFGTFGYGGGIGGWYLCLFMWLLLFAPLGVVTTLVLAGTITSTVFGSQQREVALLNAPSHLTWTAVTVASIAIGCAILLGIWRGLRRKQTSRVRQVSMTWSGHGRCPPALRGLTWFDQLFTLTPLFNVFALHFIGTTIPLVEA